jgi:hypothetical protein
MGEAVTLLAAEGGFVAVGPDEDAGEDDFLVAKFDKSFGFIDDIANALGSQSRANLRQDAERAMGIATVLNAEFRPNDGGRPA